MGYNFKLTIQQIQELITPWDRILVQVTIYRRRLISRDGHLDQSEAHDKLYRNLYENTG